MEIVYIGFGWVLGLFGTVFTDLIRDKRRAMRLKQLALRELENLKIRLAMVFYSLAASRGELDRSACAWVNNLASGHDGSILEEGLKEQLAEMSSWSDDYFSRMILSRKRPEGFHKRVPKCSSASLRSGFEALLHVDSEIACELLEILNRLDIYNDAVDQRDSYWAKTFEPDLSPGNYKIFCDALSEADNMIVYTSRKLAERIDMIQGSLDRNK